MPGSPLDGLIANYGEQIRSNPQILQQLKASLGSADEPIWQAYPHYLRDIATGDFGVSFAKQAPVGVIIGNTLPWSIFLVGVGFLLSFIVGTTLGMLAAWRRGGITDNVATPVLMTLQSFPAFFLSLVAVYFLGLKLGWFPIQHAYSNDAEISFSTSFMSDGNASACPKATTTVPRKSPAGTFQSPIVKSPAAISVSAIRDVRFGPRRSGTRRARTRVATTTSEKRRKTEPAPSRPRSRA